MDAEEKTPLQKQEELLTFLRESAEKGNQVFQVLTPVEPAFDTWWREKGSKLPSGIVQSKAAWNEVLRQMGCFED